MTKSPYFARVLSDAGLEQTIALAREAAGGSLNGLMDRDEETVIIRAPDGDQVLIALRKAPDAWITRLHREVFEEHPRIRLEGRIGGWQ